jgi:hypothetical protein
MHTFVQSLCSHFFTSVVNARSSVQGIVHALSIAAHYAGGLMETNPHSPSGTTMPQPLEKQPVKEIGGTDRFAVPKRKRKWAMHARDDTALPSSGICT